MVNDSDLINRLEGKLKPDLVITLDDLRLDNHFNLLFLNLRGNKLFKKDDLYTGVIGRGYDKLISTGNYRNEKSIFAFDKSELVVQEGNYESENPDIFDYLEFSEFTEFEDERFLVVWDSKSFHNDGCTVNEYEFLDQDRKQDSIRGVIPVKLNVGL